MGKLWVQIIGSVMLGVGISLLAISVALGHGFTRGGIPQVRNSLLSYRAYVVTSGSMEPDISPGSIIVTRAQDTYAPGDVISFVTGNNKNNVVTHRLSSNGPEGIKTKGDANEEEDAWTVPPDQVIGRVALEIPRLGMLVDFAKTPRGFVALIVIPATIIIYEELKTLLRELRRLLSPLFGALFAKVAIRNPRRKTIGSFMTAFGGLIILGTLAASNSYFSDHETVAGNFLSAGAFPSPSPSPSQSPAPETSPTPTATAIPQLTIEGGVEP